MFCLPDAHSSKRTTEDVWDSGASFVLIFPQQDDRAVLNGGCIVPTFVSLSYDRFRSRCDLFPAAIDDDDDDDDDKDEMAIGR